MKHMKILVTGATGKFGPLLVQSLVSSGHSVRVLVHRTPLAIPGVESVAGDVTNKAEILKAMDKVDAICHLATVKGDTERFIPVNLGGLYILLDCLKRTPNHPRFILLSGDNVLPIFDYESKAPMDENHPRLFVDDEYGLSKILEEEMALQYAKKYGLPVTVLRSSFIMEGMRSANLCHPKKGGWRTYLDDECRKRLEQCEDFRVVPHDKYGRPLKRQVIDPRDLSAAFLWALDSPLTSGQLFNISGPSPFDYQELADYLNKLDPKPTYRLDTPTAFSFEIDIQKAAKAGFRPKFSIFETVEWAIKKEDLKNRDGRI